MFDLIAQAIILVTGPLSVWLVNDERPEFRRWASAAALIGQPAWFYAAWIAGQWGIFIVDVLFTLGWWKGFRNYWTHPKSTRLTYK